MMMNEINTKAFCNLISCPQQL